MLKTKKISLVVVAFITLLGTLSVIFNNPVFAAEKPTNIKKTIFGKDTLSMEEVLNERVKPNLEGVAKTDSLITLILGWVSFFLPYAALLAFVGIIYAGFLYVTGFASEENVGKAKNILMWSVIGLVVIFMAYAIVSTFVKPAG